jgi:hypothetical protein
MAESQLVVQPSNLNIDFFDHIGSIEPDPPLEPMDLESASLPQLFMNFDEVEGESGPLINAIGLGPGAAHSQPAGIYDLAWPSLVDMTSFSNPLCENTATPEIGMPFTTLNDSGAQSMPNMCVRTELCHDQEIKDPLKTPAKILSDSTAMRMCEFWLHLYPKVYPKDADIRALSQLTSQPSASIEEWLNSKIRSVPSSSCDSGIGSSRSSAVSAIISQTVSSRVRSDESSIVPPETCNTLSEASSIELLSPQIQQRDPNDRTFYTKPLFTLVEDGARLVFEIPVAWRKSRLVSDKLINAAKFSRARSSCRPTFDKMLLRRNHDKRLQCTRKCGYATSEKKDWKRHEATAFPQRGLLCTVPAAISTCNALFCAYCPAEGRQENPTVKHMKSEHRLTFLSESDKKMGVCNQIFYRKEHMETHFRNKHPGLHPDAWFRIGAFEVKNSAFPKRCGFCTKTFSSWDERIDHICVHFERDGLDMLQWKDSYDSDDLDRNKRHRRDDDPDDRSDHQDGDEDDGNDDGKGGGSAGKRGNGKKANTSIGQVGGDRSSNNRLQSRGISLSDRDPASDEEQIFAPKRVYDWLEDVLEPAESHLNDESPAQHLEVRQLARATDAAPTFSSPISVKELGSLHTFSDGATSTNILTPTRRQEAKFQHFESSNHSIHPQTRCLASTDTENASMGSNADAFIGKRPASHLGDRVLPDERLKRGYEERDEPVSLHGIPGAGTTVVRSESLSNDELNNPNPPRSASLLQPPAAAPPNPPQYSSILQQLSEQPTESPLQEFMRTLSFHDRSFISPLQFTKRSSSKVDSRPLQSPKSVTFSSVAPTVLSLAGASTVEIVTPSLSPSVETAPSVKTMPSMKTMPSVKTTPSVSSVPALRNGVSVLSSYESIDEEPIQGTPLLNSDGDELDPPKLSCCFWFLDCHVKYTEEDQWKEHCLTHFRGKLPPKVSVCLFCSLKFESTNSNHSWAMRMDHIARYHRFGFNLRIARQPDYDLFTYLWKQKIICEADYQELMTNYRLSRPPQHFVAHGGRVREDRLRGGVPPAMRVTVLPSFTPMRD